MQTTEQKLQYLLDRLEIQNGGGQDDHQGDDCELPSRRSGLLRRDASRSGYARTVSSRLRPPDRESAGSAGAVTDASVWPPDGHSVLRPPPRSSVGDVVPWD